MVYGCKVELSGAAPQKIPLPIDLDVLARIPAGQIDPGIVDTPEAYMVLRVGRQRPGSAEVETWTIPKAPYVEWLTEQARALNRTIASPDLNARLDSLDPNLWLRKAFR